MSQFFLAVDMHGGDYGVSHITEAIASSADLLGEDVSFVLCGREEDIQFEISRLRLGSYQESGRFVVSPSEPTPVVSGLTSRLWRSAPHSSLVRCISLQKEGLVHASLSAGDTGALYGTSLFVLGRVPHVERPALAVALPTTRETPTLLLDVGANVDCRPEHLAQFAMMGDAYYRKIVPGTSPTIGLLNVGRESYKGTEAVRKAAVLIEKSLPDAYIGFVEGDQILSGVADVVVCDGFCGNALLKMSESLYYFIRQKLSGVLSQDAIERMSLFNNELYGSVPILGLNGHVFKAHGSSSVTALSHALIKAVQTVY